MRATKTKSERFREWQALRPQYAPLLAWLRMPQEQYEELIRRSAGEAQSEKRDVESEE